MKKILAITGIRSDYGIMVPVFEAIMSSSQLSLELIVTGAHLSKNHGYTIEQIQRDGIPIAERIESLISGDSKESRLKGAAVQLSGLSQAVSRIKPDLLMVLGDREESVTTALTGVYLDIPVVHLCGGDRVIGNVDDVVRHAVTKLSHVHLVTNSDSEQRVIRLGEEPFRVHNVGNPSLDRFRQLPSMTREEIFNYHGLDHSLMDQPLLVVVQHVLSSEQDKSYDQMTETMKALEQLGWPAVVIHPNSDPGNFDLIRCINEYQDLEHINFCKNVPTLEFCNTLRQASCLIGNSSLGLLEAPFLKLPAINVGNRQKGRMHGKNLIFMEHDRSKIVDLVSKICLDETFRSTLIDEVCPYGDGHSAARIVRILEDLAMDEKLLIKEITY